MAGVRLIAGRYGGRKLAAPRNDRTHPMSERARGAMFNSLGASIQDARVLDAFAGTGAIGLEALSRGAHSVVFVERDRVAQKVLAENVALLGVENTAKCINTSVRQWLDTYDGESFDIIFADPPYHNPQFSTIEEILRLLKADGTMILSHPGRGEVPIQNESLFVVDSRSYGNAHLTYFRRKV